AGFEPTRSRTGSRILPSTRPSSPPVNATTKHQTPTAARARACTRLNMSHDGTDAPRERVGPPGSRRGAAGAEGPAAGGRHRHGRADFAGSALRDGLCQRARLGAQAGRDAPRPRGGTRAAPVAARPRAADETDPSPDLRVRSDGRARRANEPAD